MKVRVTRGTVGIAEKLDDGRTIYRSKNALDGAFNLDFDQAKRLINIGVAEKVIEDYSDMTVSELKEYAAEEGIDIRGCRNKSDYINRIESVEREESSKEIEEAENDSDEDDIPAFDASDALA